MNTSGQSRPLQDDESTRRVQLARIHIARKDLDWDEAFYRQFLQKEFGVASSSDLDIRGRQRLIDHFVKCGWQPRKARPTGAPRPAGKAPRRPTPSKLMLPMCRKIRAQLISLGGRPDTYADGIAQQMFGVQYFEWCQSDQLHAIIAALAIEQARCGVAYHPTVKPRA